MKHWWNRRDTRKPMHTDVNISLCQIVQDRLNMDRHGNEPEPPLWKSGD